MKQRAWLSYLSAGLAAVALFSGYSIQLPNPIESPSLFQRVAMSVQPYAWGTGLAAGLVIILIELVQGITAGPQFRKETIQQVLDVLVAQCEGNPRENRITLFRKRSGLGVICRGLWRLGWTFWHPEKRHKLSALARVRLRGTYLHVYVRSSKARHPLSTAAFRIAERRDLCEGMAGRAWDEQGFICVSNLPKIKEEDRLRIQRMTVEEILQLPPMTRVRRYVEATGIRRTEQLRSIDSFARHFMGHDIRTGKGEPWGVLLLDSEREECPFSPSGDGGEFGSMFRAQAVVLGNLLH
jgi:hypothetical protein